MSVAKLKITKGGESGVLILGMFKDRSWRLEAPVSWLPASSGKWSRVRNATKFRQFSFLSLADPAGHSVADFPEPPYTQQQTFQANLISHFWFFEMPGDPFDVEVLACPPPSKNFEIRETWAASASVEVVQGEAAGMEIKDVDTGATAIYVYKGLGLVIGFPKIPGLGGVPGKIVDGANKFKDAASKGGLSSSGPPNAFTAPGYLTVYDFEGDATLQTIYNVGVGTDKSANVFDFGGAVNNLPGFMVHIDSFSTGRTFSLPSSGFSSGSMTLITRDPSAPPAPSAPPTGGRGKFSGLSDN